MVHVCKDLNSKSEKTETEQAMYQIQFEKEMSSRKKGRKAHADCALGKYKLVANVNRTFVIMECKSQVPTVIALESHS